MPRAARPAGPTRKQTDDYFASDIHGEVPASARMLERYMPGAPAGDDQLRRATTHETSLPKPVRELIIIAVQAALKKDPSGHARSGVDAGVSPQEIHDACALVLWLAGTPAYQVGMLAVAAADAHAARRTRLLRRRPSRARTTAGARTTR
jgi:alkylhydroperoxidase/carboxymuconolactone decarboxylase family protein YurZ